MTTMNEMEREALGAFRRALERAVEHATSDLVRLTFSTEKAVQLLNLLSPDDADVEEASRDELLAAMARIARNVCDCDAREGEEAPVSPTEHRGYCHYSLAHRAVPESTEPLVWDDNLTLAQGTP